MSDSDVPSDAPIGTGRCPVCDYKAKPGDRICLMCGAELPESIFADVTLPDETPANVSAEETAIIDVPEQKAHLAEADNPPAEPTPAAEDQEPIAEDPSNESEPEDEQVAELPVVDSSTEIPVDDEYEPLGEVYEAELKERVAPVTAILVALFVIVTIGVGAIILPAAMASPVSLAFFPTTTPLPPTLTFTPTITPFPSETPQPTQTPTIAPSPSPVPTLQPPQTHAIAAGETLFSLSFVYNVSVESIAELNEFSEGAFLVQGQEILVPYPTATPPLESIILELDGQTFVADPTNCQRYEIQSNDSIVSIGAAVGVDYRAILEVNRLDTNSVIRPGQTLCIPTIAFFDGELPPTPGPSPTPLPTLPPAGAQLMFPANEASFAAEQTILLQWAAVEDLAEDEWYMVELIDQDDLGSYPQRAYTRDNSFRVPSEWRSDSTEPHRYQWRVTIVKVIGVRQDGEFIRAFEGLPSEPHFFVWDGS